jgi:hypothetical protein
LNLRNIKISISTRALQKAALIGFPAVALSTFAISAHASLLFNGSFEETTNGAGQLGYNTNATDWSVPAPDGSYAFLFTSGSADSTGVTGQYGNLQLWGPGDGSANGLPASSPDGGNYVALDADFQPGALSQTISGLTAGDEYTVGFWWAAAQQEGFTGATTNQLTVTFGSEEQATSVYNLPSEGFSGWMYQTFNFDATSTSEVLSFLAVGSPQVPPFTLLDGVTLYASPEPGTFALMSGGLGLVSLGIVGSKKRSKR